MTTFTTPTDWKSENWWRNRSKEERLFHLHIPKRWKHIGFKDLKLPSEVMEQANDWLNNFQVGSCVYIHGRSGSGKTILGQALARKIVCSNEISGRFLSSERYIDMLQDSFDNNNLLPEMYSTPYLLKYVQGVFDVLVLDGVGQERDTEFTRHEIGSLIRRRYEDDRSLIITTSMNPMDFVRRYGDRVKLTISEMDIIKVA